MGPRKPTNDAEAICETVQRPTMRFVPVKTAERQAALLDHKTREFLVRQRTQVINAIRAHLAEFGIVVPQGIHNIDRLLATTEEAPEAAWPGLTMLADQLRDTHDRIAAVTARIEAPQREDPLARRLASVPGIGVIAAVADSSANANATTRPIDATASAELRRMTAGCSRSRVQNRSPRSRVSAQNHAN